MQSDLSRDIDLMPLGMVNIKVKGGG